eukprot:2120152-Amphidinium_carterae.1
MGMTKLRTCARQALGKGAGLRRSALLELMAHGGPAADLQVLADLSTVRVWHSLTGASLLARIAARWSGLSKLGCGAMPSNQVEGEDPRAT